MAAINTGQLPVIADKVKSILIEDGGVHINFESGASFFGHSYTTERPYANSRKNVVKTGNSVDSVNQVKEN